MTARRGITLLRIYLGALWCTVLFENLAFSRYTPDGYERLIERYAAETNAPGFWSDGVMGFVADNSELFARLQFVAELSFAVLLVLGVATALAALASAGFLFGLWLSELGIFWIWELLSIAAIAAVVGLASLPELRRPGGVRERALGRRTFGELDLGARLGLAVAGGLLLWVAILAADTGGGDNSLVAWRSALLFSVLLAACAFLDRLRTDEPDARTSSGAPVQSSPGASR